MLPQALQLFSAVQWEQHHFLPRLKRQSCTSLALFTGQYRVDCDGLARPNSNQVTTSESIALQGMISFHVELGRMAAPDFEQGQPGELATRIARAVERALKESRAIDLEALW